MQYCILFQEKNVMLKMRIWFIEEQNKLSLRSNFYDNYNRKR